MKKITIILFSLILVLSLFSAGVFADDEIPQELQLLRLTDKADILTDSEEEALLSMLDEISERQQCDVAIVTVIDLPEGYSSAESFADDVYDYCGFGMGSDDDGILLALVMGSRDWHVTTCGYGITAITDAGREYMSEIFLPYLGDGHYAKGFTKYAQLCDELITMAKNGEPYERKNTPKVVDWVKWIGCSLAIGVFAAFIYTSALKGQMKSVAYQRAASSYLLEDSLNIDQSRDTFLYASVAKTAKVKEKSSSDSDDSSNRSSKGSSTHTGSSGKTHGGGGGKF